ncbi:MAG: AAA family ATPase [Limnohabitans sp.]|nr:AAA family ATPase [Limnohabitans sp.]
MKFTIQKPSDSFLEIEIILSEKIVFLGANGTGKSKLGKFIEKSVFSQTQSGFNQNQNSLNHKKQELSIVEGSIDQLTRQISDFNKATDEQVLNIGLEYQERKILLPSQEIFSRKEFIELLFQGKIQIGNLTFSNNSFLAGLPPQSLNDIDGGTIEFGGIILDIDLMKIDKENPKSIETAKEYFRKKNKVLLDNELDKRNKLVKEIANLEIQLKNFTTDSFKFCQRISAHRSLVFNPNNSPKDKDTALKELLYGNSNHTQNTDNKWNNSPLQSDFDKLLIALISEEAELGAKYRQSKIKSEEAKTKLDLIIETWNKLLPHRKINIEGLKLSVQCKNSAEYAISELSDGEKTIFYLLGQCLLTPENSLIIVDEPDIHVHKSILSNLFSEIEVIKKNCSFIYITHDIDFATSRNGKKYVLLDYVHENKWDIEEIDKNDTIPEDVLTAISGTRKPILFVEGKKDTSLDNIYNRIYDDLTVIQVKSCSEVKSYTKALNKNKRFHKVKCFGLIDRDGLETNVINSLKEDGIFVLPLAIIENLFLHPTIAEEVYKIVGEGIVFSNETYIDNALGWINSDENWKVKWIKEQLSSDLQRKINEIPNKLDDLEKYPMLNYEIAAKSNEVLLDLDSINNKEDSDENKLLNLLKICRGKHLIPKFANSLGLRDKKSLENKILNNLNSDLVTKLKSILPIIE